MWIPCFSSAFAHRGCFWWCELFDVILSEIKLDRSKESSWFQFKFQNRFNHFLKYLAAFLNFCATSWSQAEESESSHHELNLFSSPCHLCKANKELNPEFLPRGKCNCSKLALAKCWFSFKFTGTYERLLFHGPCVHSTTRDSVSRMVIHLHCHWGWQFILQLLLCPWVRHSHSVAQ